MRVGILMLGESGRPWLHTSRGRANELVSAGTHKQITKKLIQELVAGTSYSDPGRHYIPKIQVKTAIPLLNPPQQPSTMNLFYPVKDQSSYGERNFLEIWSGPLSMPSLTRLREVYGANV